MRSLTLVCSLIGIFQFNVVNAEDALDLNTAAKKANNPVSDAWLLIMQNDYTALEGDAIDGTEYRNRISAQPIMPISSISSTGAKPRPPSSA